MSELESELQNPPVYFRYGDAKIFATLVSSLAEIVEEVALRVTKDGVTAKGMDPAKVAYIEVSIPYTNFLEYDVKEELTIGVNLASLERALSRAKKGYTLSLKADQSRVLVVVEGNVTRTYSLPNIEVASESVDIKLEHTARARVLSDPFKRAITDAGQFSDVVELEATESYLAVRGVGERRAESKFLSGTASLVELDVKEPARARYDVSYLEKVLDLTKVAENIDVQFKTDSPLELNFESPGGFTVRYVLAPSAVGAGAAPPPAEEKGRKEREAEAEEEEEAAEEEAGEEEEEGESEEEE